MQSFQGLGLAGLELLRKTGDAFRDSGGYRSGFPADVDLVASYADILQIGSRNMHNYPCCWKWAGLGKPVLLKRGYAATIEEWLAAATILPRRKQPDYPL